MRRRPGSKRGPMSEEQRRKRPPSVHPFFLTRPITGRIPPNAIGPRGAADRTARTTERDSAVVRGSLLVRLPHRDDANAQSRLFLTNMQVG